MSNKHFVRILGTGAGNFLFITKKGSGRSKIGSRQDKKSKIRE